MHSKHAFEQYSCEFSLLHRETRAGHIDFQLWLLWAATLVYSHFYRLTIDQQNTAVRPPIPAIYCILRTSTKCPSGEIQPEGRYGRDRKRSLIHRSSLQLVRDTYAHDHRRRAPFRLGSVLPLNISRVVSSC